MQRTADQVLSDGNDFHGADALLAFGNVLSVS
jgi:hypothetical protein